MKYLKTYENFSDFGRLSDDEDEMNKMNSQEEEETSTCPECGREECDCEPEYEDEYEDDYEDDYEEERNWGDQGLVESKGGLTAKQKKLPKGMQDAILKKMGKNVEKDDKCGKDCKCKDDKCGKNCKCKDKKEDKEKEEIKGLTAKQKKLPIALQKSILARKK